MAFELCSTPQKKKVFTRIYTVKCQKRDWHIEKIDFDIIPRPNQNVKKFLNFTFWWLFTIFFIYLEKREIPRAEALEIYKKCKKKLANIQWIPIGFNNKNWYLSTPKEIGVVNHFLILKWLIWKLKFIQEIDKTKFSTNQSNLNLCTKVVF